MARSSPKKRPARRPKAKPSPKRDARGRFVAAKKPTPRKPAPRKPAPRKPVPVIDRLEQARLELRRARRFTKTTKYRELIREAPIATAALKDVRQKLTRRIEKLAEKAGGPSKPARERKRERDRRYQQNRRNLSRTLGEMFSKRIRILGAEGIDEYLDEYDVTEHVFWVEFRKRYV